MKTYQYPGYFLTTDIEPEDKSFIASWDVTEEQAQVIEQGAILEVNEGELVIESNIE